MDHCFSNTTAPSAEVSSSTSQQRLKMHVDAEDSCEISCELGVDGEVAQLLPLDGHLTFPSRDSFPPAVTSLFVFLHNRLPTTLFSTMLEGLT